MSAASESGVDVYSVWLDIQSLTFAVSYTILFESVKLVKNVNNLQILIQENWKNRQKIIYKMESLNADNTKQDVS